MARKELLRARGKMIDGRNPRSKILWHCPFNDDLYVNLSSSFSSWLLHAAVCHISLNCGPICRQNNTLDFCFDFLDMVPSPQSRNCLFHFFKRTDILSLLCILKKKHFWPGLQMCYEVNWPYGYLCMYGQDIVFQYVQVHSIHTTVHTVVLLYWTKPPFTRQDS